jgi:hypothetical protein
MPEIIAVFLGKTLAEGIRVYLRFLLKLLLPISLKASLLLNSPQYRESSFFTQ